MQATQQSSAQQLVVDDDGVAAHDVSSFCEEEDLGSHFVLLQTRSYTSGLEEHPEAMDEPSLLPVPATATVAKVGSHLGVDSQFAADELLGTASKIHEGNKQYQQRRRLQQHQQQPYQARSHHGQYLESQYTQRRQQHVPQPLQLQYQRQESIPEAVNTYQQPLLGGPLQRQQYRRLRHQQPARSKQPQQTQQGSQQQKQLFRVRAHCRTTGAVHTTVVTPAIVLQMLATRRTQLTAGYVGAMAACQRAEAAVQAQCRRSMIANQANIGGVDSITATASTSNSSSSCCNGGTFLAGEDNGRPNLGRTRERRNACPRRRLTFESACRLLPPR